MGALKRRPPLSHLVLMWADLVGDEDVEFAYDLIREICEDVGPGTPGSPQEERRAALVERRMSEAGFDEVVTEPFGLRPNAFFGWFKLGSAWVVVAILFYVFGRFPGNPAVLLGTSVVAAAFSGLVILTAALEFFLYREFVDFLFPKASSQNVVGVIRPPRDPKDAPPAPDGGNRPRIVLLSGHHDSAWAFRWLEKLGFGYYVMMGFIFMGIFSVFLASVAQVFLAAFVPANVVRFGSVMDYACLVLAPLALVAATFFVDTGKDGGTVPGANDNLSGVALAVAVGRFLKRHPEIHPPGVEIRVVSFGSEEAGTRGSKRYVAAHLEELEAGSAACCNFDTLATERISIFTTDRNSTLRLDRALAEELGAAAEAAGVSHSVQPFPVFGGGTDALSFAERGIRATTLYAMELPGDMTAWYHQPADDLSQVNRNALRNALRVVVQWLGSWANGES
ncbi:MAG: hypothetical protein Kow0069_03430 [Promethearchaeota archaeon]